MSLTSINIGVINATFFSPIPTIGAASFSSPTTLGSITIGSVTGNFTSYVVGRTGGSQGTFTSTSQTSASYTDPTALTANVQYTYTITPYIGGIVGIPFTGIVNPNNGSTPGKIYTLASAPTLTYNGAGSSTSQISFTFTGGSYTNLSVQFPLGTFITTTTTSPYTGGSYSANTQNTYYVYAINGDSYGGLTGISTGTNVSVSSSSVAVCTLAEITAASFSSPTALTTIAISSITGTYTSFNVYRGGASIASAQTGTSYTNNSGLANNTQYTYSLYPVNALSYASTTAFTAITNPKTGTTAGTIYTLASPATLSLAYAGATSSTTTVSFTWIGTLNNFATLSIQTSTVAATGVLSTPAYNEATQTYTTGASYTANQSVTLYAFAVNVDGIGSGVAAAQASVNTCTWASANTPSFSSTSGTGTTLACSGTFVNAYVTYSPTTGSPATGSLITGTNSISQAYSSVVSGTYTFNVYPVNSLSYPASATGTNFATNTVVIPTSAVITAASFSSPTALGQIVISSITGTFTSFTVSRTGGSQGLYTSAAQTFTNTGSFTDPTALTANTQYTYTITPISGGSSGTVFTAITNPKTGTTAGTIYTLGSPATLSLAYNGGGSSTTAVSFTWIGTASNFATLSIQTSASAATGVLSTPAYNAATQTYTTGASYSANQSVTLYVFAVNADGIGSGVTAAQASVNTCTLAAITAASFSSPTALTTIVISTITGTYTSFNVYRGGASIASGQTGTSYTNNSGLANNTQYTYSLYPINALSYASTTAFTAITNPKTGTTAGTIYTLGSPATLSLAYNGGGSSTTAVSFTWIGTASNFATLSIQTSASAATGVLSTPAYNAATQTYTTGASYSANTQVTLYAFAVNVDGIGSGVAAAQGSINTCTWGSCNAPTYSATTATGTTLACGGTFSKVYITYSGAGSPASGTTVTGTNSISQAYTSMSSSTAYTFNCYPVNALNYQSSTAASAGVTTLSSGPTPIIQYIFNSSYVSGNHLKNMITGAFDLNLQTATITTIGGKNCLSTGTGTTQFATVNTGVSNNATTLISASTAYAAITIIIWVYRTTTQGTAGVWDWYNTANNATNIEFQVDANRLMTYFNTGGAYPSMGALTGSTWCMFTLVFNGSGYTTYLNGNAATATGTNASTTNANFLNIARNSIRFGKTIFSPGDPQFTGYIADYRTYSSALTQAQIAAIFTAGISNA
jgi:hypothetical protein